MVDKEAVLKIVAKKEGTRLLTFSPSYLQFLDACSFKQNYLISTSSIERLKSPTFHCLWTSVFLFFLSPVVNERSPAFLPAFSSVDCGFLPAHFLCPNERPCVLYGGFTPNSSSWATFWRRTHFLQMPAFKGYLTHAHFWSADSLDFCKKTCSFQGSSK